MLPREQLASREADPQLLGVLVQLGRQVGQQLTTQQQPLFPVELGPLLRAEDEAGGLHVPYAWIVGEQFVLADVGTRVILERSHEEVDKISGDA